jgi:hypothetical protein
MDDRYLEYSHDYVHYFISGDMQERFSSSNDPIFFMHHGNKFTREYSKLSLLKVLWILFGKCGAKRSRIGFNVKGNIQGMMGNACRNGISPMPICHCCSHFEIWMPSPTIILTICTNMPPGQVAKRMANPKNAEIPSEEGKEIIEKITK